MGLAGVLPQFVILALGSFPDTFIFLILRTIELAFSSVRSPLKIRSSVAVHLTFFPNLFCSASSFHVDPVHCLPPLCIAVVFSQEPHSIERFHLLLLRESFYSMVKSADKLIGKKIIVVGGTSGSVSPNVFISKCAYDVDEISGSGLEQHRHLSMQTP